MKNKKGFTLIELIAVIVILGIVISLASLSIISVSKNVKERNYNSLIKRIEISGEKFYEDTGLTKFTVQTLIDEGYIEPDDNENIYDPRNSKIMLNCHMITVDENGEALYDESDETANCEFDSSVYTALEMYYQNTETEEKTKISIANPPWFNYYGKLIVISTKDNVLSNSISYSWKSKLNPGVIISTKDTYDINNEINDYVEANVYDNSSGKNYIASSVIKVDTTAPTIEILTEVDKTWTTSKTIKFSLKDNLSGIESYAIVTSGKTLKDTNWKEVENNSKEIIIEKTIGKDQTFFEKEFIIYVKDLAQNISELIFTIYNVDNSAPECLITSQANEGDWQKSRDIGYGCNDEHSGCTDESFGTKNFTTTLKTSNVEFTVTDNVGNSKNCNPTANIYVDNTEPVIEVDVKTEDGRKVTLNVNTTNDVLSGIENYSFSLNDGDFITQSSNKNEYTFDNCDEKTFKVYATSNTGIKSDEVIVKATPHTCEAEINIDIDGTLDGTLANNFIKIGETVDINFKTNSTGTITTSVTKFRRISNNTTSGSDNVPVTDINILDNKVTITGRYEGWAEITLYVAQKAPYTNASKTFELYIYTPASTEYTSTSQIGWDADNYGWWWQPTLNSYYVSGWAFIPETRFINGLNYGTVTQMSDCNANSSYLKNGYRCKWFLFNSSGYLNDSASGSGCYGVSIENLKNKLKTGKYTTNPKTCSQCGVSEQSSASKRKCYD